MTLHETLTADMDAKQADPRLSGIIKLAILAVGGQGGGVLTSWIEDVARAQGYAVQATSVAGVSRLCWAATKGSMKTETWVSPSL